jgi:hypothetical protein
MYSDPKKILEEVLRHCDSIGLKKKDIWDMKRLLTWQIPDHLVVDTKGQNHQTMLKQNVTIVDRTPVPELSSSKIYK